MLSGSPSATMIPVKDLANTRRFYEDMLGFRPDMDKAPEAVSYLSGDSRFNLYATESRARTRGDAQ
jgi:catechol 2,3-dioxygenase-like lactoylglutathione lyase family enzyme